MANALGGVPSIQSWQQGAGYYNTLSSKLAFNSRYRRVYVVNPAISWSNDLIQASQSGFPQLAPQFSSAAPPLQIATGKL